MLRDCTRADQHEKSDHMRATSCFPLLALLVAQSASAAPTYLKCTIVSSASESRTFDVTLDEANGRVTQQGANGGSFQADGVFTADKVTYQSVYGSGARVTDRYEIDRTSLAIVESFTTDSPEFPQIKPSTLRTTGTCKLVTATKGRKF